MSTGYYRYEPRRLGYRELARIVRGQGTPLLMWIMKTLGISWHSAWARKYPTSIRAWVINPQELGKEISVALALARTELNALGFESVAVLGQEGCLYPSESATELYRHSSGSAKATVTFSRNGTVQRTVVTFASAFEDGRLFYTTNWDELDGPPTHLGKELFKKPAAAAWKAHEERLAAAGSPLLSINDSEAALDFQQRIEQETWDWFIKRRIMVECTPQEVERAQRRLDAVRGFGEAAGSNAAEMLEMAHAMERKQTRRDVLWAFGVTLALFLLVGFVWWEPKMLWMLAVALIIHEFGHYITMRAFGYRNLRMIFVPLGGAAVIGQNFNVPGWKKAIVALMGPLPGILIALVLGIITLIQGPNELRFDIALMFLVLNALNLLPIFPLDGGMYLNAILFCRNAKIEIVFKTLAVAVLAVAAITMRDFILGALAYFLFLGLRPSYRLARKTEQLRREIEIPSVNDPTELPVEIKNRVIDGVKEALRKPASAKTVAAHALGMFERLNARPPGIAGTVVLLGIYGMTFVMAIVSAAGLGSRYGKSEAAKPRTLWLCESAPPTITRRPPAQYLAAITFKTVDNRDDFLAAAKKYFPTNQLITIGRTVFMSYAKEQARTLDREIAVHFAWAAVESDIGLGNWRKRPTCHWTFTAPNEETALALEREINSYSEVSALFTVYPAWVPGRQLSEEERRSRETLRKLRDIQIDLPGNESEEKQKTESNLRDSIAKTIAAIQRAAATDETFDAATVAWYTNLVAFTNNVDFIDDAGAEGAKRLGRAPDDETTGASYLDVKRNGRELRVDIQFLRMEQGFPAFGNWLCAQNCTDIFYVFKMD